MQESERLLQALTTCRGKSLYIVISDSWSIEKLKRIACSKLCCSAMCKPRWQNSRLILGGLQIADTVSSRKIGVQQLLILYLHLGCSHLWCTSWFSLLLLHSTWLSRDVLPEKSEFDLLLISSRFFNWKKVGWSLLSEGTVSKVAVGTYCSNQWKAFFPSEVPALKFCITRRIIPCDNWHRAQCE